MTIYSVSSSTASEIFVHLQENPSKKHSTLDQKYMVTSKELCDS